MINVTDYVCVYIECAENHDRKMILTEIQSGINQLTINMQIRKEL